MKKDSSHIFCIDKFREGSQVEYDHIFNYYYDDIYEFVYGFVKSQTEAQDITTDALIKIWKLRENFIASEGIKAFLYTTARNASIDFIRLTQRQRAAMEDINHLLEREEQGYIENSQIEAEFLKEVIREIERLPAKCREVFKLMFFDDLKVAEAADLMGITTKNAQTQKERAIKLLRSRLNIGHLL